MTDRAVTPATEPLTESMCIETDWPRDDKGYGRRMLKGQRWSAHRRAWFLANGVIPEGMVVCHACDNPPCINVAHLWLGTPSQNTLDRHAKGRDATGDRNGSRVHPERRPRGAVMRRPQPGVRNGQAKLTWALVEHIRNRSERRGEAAAIARELGLDPTTVRRVVLGRSWVR